MQRFRITDSFGLFSKILFFGLFECPKLQRNLGKHPKLRLSRHSQDSRNYELRLTRMPSCAVLCQLSRNVTHVLPRPVRYQLFSISKYRQKNIAIFDIIVMTSFFIRSLLFPAAPRFATNLSTVFDVRSWYLPLTVSGATQACFSCHEELKKIFQILEVFPQ